MQRVGNGDNGHTKTSPGIKNKKICFAITYIMRTVRFKKQVFSVCKYITSTLHKKQTHTPQGLTSVAEPPLFWAAPASEVRGPGADYGTDQVGSASATGSSGSMH